MGWTWDYCEDTLTVPRLEALHTEWRKNPPLVLMIKAFLGIKDAPENKLKPPAFLDKPDFEE
jgi:hypothetical protein